MDSTAPSKSAKPLHNFSLPQLQWAAQKNAASFRRRESTDHHQTPPRKDAGEENGGEGKPWKLRPRKEVCKAASLSKKETPIESGDDNKNGNNGNCTGVPVKSKRVRVLGEEKKKEKRRIWISLSKEEIDEDLYALTGNKPARRPRKWPKNVQKQLDNLFPGLYLVGIDAESYRVNDASK